MHLEMNAGKLQDTNNRLHLRHLIVREINCVASKIHLPLMAFQNGSESNWNIGNLQYARCVADTKTAIGCAGVAVLQQLN